MANVSVIGAGSWGTALSLLLSGNGHKVTLWSIMEQEVKMLNEKREHLDKLPGVKLPEEMKITTDLEESIRGAELLVLAVPSPFTRSTAHAMAPYVEKGQIIVNVAKGIEEGTLMTLTDIIEEEIPAGQPCFPAPAMRKRWDAAFLPQWWQEPVTGRRRSLSRIFL